ncbi:hypothetical protein ERJ75_001040300 [Trypanosoma vivax]|nr:hypothetical protein ERJ75_001040300 [Trypanosoma vivax]
MTNSTSNDSTEELFNVLLEKFTRSVIVVAIVGGLVLCFCLVFIVGHLFSTGWIKKFFDKRRVLPDALPLSEGDKEELKRRALGYGVTDVAVVVREGNSDLLVTSSAPLTRVQSFCEACGDRPSEELDTKRTIAIPVTSRSPLQRPSETEIEVIDQETPTCKVCFPKKLVDKDSSGVYHLYILRPPNLVYGSAEYYGSNDGVSGRRSLQEDGRTPYTGESNSPECGTDVSYSRDPTA